MIVHSHGGRTPSVTSWSRTILTPGSSTPRMAWVIMHTPKGNPISPVLLGRDHHIHRLPTIDVRLVVPAIVEAGLSQIYLGFLHFTTLWTLGNGRVLKQSHCQFSVQKAFSRLPNTTGDEVKSIAP